MKTLISAVLALTLLGTAGASAQSWRGNDSSHFTQSRFSQSQGRQDGYRGGYRDDHRGNVGSQIGLGLGLFALAAIIASQSQPDYRAQGYDNGYYGR